MRNTAEPEGAAAIPRKDADVSSKTPWRCQTRPQGVKAGHAVTCTHPIELVRSQQKSYQFKSYVGFPKLRPSSLFIIENHFLYAHGTTTTAGCEICSIGV